jgi:hypothetical protein
MSEVTVAAAAAAAAATTTQDIPLSFDWRGTKNLYRLSRDGSHVEMQLTRGKVALLDIESLSTVIPFRWYAEPMTDTSWRARCNIPRGVHEYKKKMYMHRLLCPLLIEIDHKNGNGLDNRLSNLREGHYNNVNQNNLRMNKRNKSGENGIYQESKSSGVRFEWNEDGITHKKRFAFSRHGGKAGALEAAKQFREQVYARTKNTNGKRPKFGCDDGDDDDDDDKGSGDCVIEKPLNLEVFLARGKVGM